MGKPINTQPLECATVNDIQVGQTVYISDPLNKPDWREKCVNILTAKVKSIDTSTKTTFVTLTHLDNACTIMSVPLFTIWSSSEHLMGDFGSGEQKFRIAPLLENYVDPSERFTKNQIVYIGDDDAAVLTGRVVEVGTGRHTGHLIMTNVDNCLRYCARATVGDVYLTEEEALCASGATRVKRLAVYNKRKVIARANDVIALFQKIIDDNCTQWYDYTLKELEEIVIEFKILEAELRIDLSEHFRDDFSDKERAKMKEIYCLAKPVRMRAEAILEPIITTIPKCDVQPPVDISRLRRLFNRYLLGSSLEEDDIYYESDVVDHLPEFVLAFTVTRGTSYQDWINNLTANFKGHLSMELAQKIALCGEDDGATLPDTPDLKDFFEDIGRILS